MRKLIIVASLIAVGGMAGAASADGGARYQTISGRNIVWHEPKAEQPYALRGVDAGPKAEKARVEFRVHGRAGTTLELRPQTSR